MNAFERLRGASPLVVYIDLKSPYAFISIEPTRAVARTAGVPVEWRPFTLDIPSYLGSARLDASGRVIESRRSASQWSGVKYAYRDARRYARLGGRVLRGTEKIWDSSLAGIGLLWAGRQGADIVERYLDSCFPRFWRRELDIEDPGVIVARLAEAGADVDGFEAFAAGAGRAAHDRLNAEAFAAGVFCVPSYLVADEFWFGREHLPRVAWLLGGRSGPAPDPAYPLPGDPHAIDAGIGPIARGPDGRKRLRVAIDIRDPRVWLAWAPTLAMARALDLMVEWLPFEVAPPVPPPVPRAAELRGTAHRRYRAEQHVREWMCYADARGLPLESLYGQGDATAVHLGLHWAGLQAARDARLRAPAEAWLGTVLAAYWGGRFDPADLASVAASLTAAGMPANDFPAWADTAGPGALADLRAELQAAGVFQVPTYLAGAEPFQGMAHLPLLRALYSAPRHAGA